MVTFRTPTSDDFVLVVSGDGYRSRQRFAGGQTAFFLPVDRGGFSLPDGLYKWELVPTPELSTETAAKQGPPAHRSRRWPRSRPRPTGWNRAMF